MNPLGNILVEQEALSPEVLAEVQRVQLESKRPVDEILLEQGLVTPVQIAKGLATQYEIEYLEMNEYFRLEPEEVRLVPESLARRYGLIPIRKESNRSMTIAMSDPLDLDAINTVRSVTGLEVRKVVSTKEEILKAIDKFYTDDAHIERNLKDIVDLETIDLEIPDSDSPLDPNQLRVQANDAPVVRFVNLLLMQAVRDRASDIHFEPGQYQVTVRLRVDGVLREVTPPPKHLYSAIVTRIKILADMDIAERRLPLDGRFMFKLTDHTVDVRVSSLPEVHGEKLVLRVLDQSSLKVNLEEIGFDKDNLSRFQRVLKMPHGIILITGPTGSGKTTTLYSALSYIKSPERNIQTVEDPVEYLLEGINQMSIKEKIGLDFARCLRAILRQDPDVVMIGEMRDTETAQIAMRAALTGHLVLSTLHTNDATSAFSRLRDIGIPAYLIAATIKLVISQRLVRKICEHCKAESAPAADDFTVASSVFPEISDWTFYAGEGCEFCGHTGFRGRTALLEYVEVNDAVGRLITDHAGDHDVRNHALQGGMESLVRNGIKKVKQGVTTLNEVLNVWPNLDGE